MSDTSSRASAGPHDLVVRAVFVPEGRQPPPEFAAEFDPLKFPATLDPETGTITCDGAGTNFDGDVRAEWHPDEAPGPEDDEDKTAPGAGKDNRG